MLYKSIAQRDSVREGYVANLLDLGVITPGDADGIHSRSMARLEDELGKRAFQYTRSDGSTWKLTLADLIDRTPAMEMAYNPNDCAEIRWSAPEGSEERATCKRRAPEGQQTRMAKYREWFATRERPH